MGDKSYFQYFPLEFVAILAISGVLVRSII